VTDSVRKNLFDLQQISDNVRATVPYERYKRGKEELWVFLREKYPKFLLYPLLYLSYVVRGAWHKTDAAPPRGGAGGTVPFPQPTKANNLIVRLPGKNLNKELLNG
jgi:hypothetical protein